MRVSNSVMKLIDDGVKEQRYEWCGGEMKVEVWGRVWVDEVEFLKFFRVMGSFCVVEIDICFVFDVW